MKRAQRFGVIDPNLEKEKKKARMLRFGATLISNEGNYTKKKIKS